eukprot:TRINITY_DN59519_c0_g1_i1.p1 TRINITY_DN59519_c0_g1~~TRINITY_DN59519_c0_g1_i1.p1  ORF type:complete len:298 (+),score=35.76 TRINITY_DN59519_c0_g1_i1:198-1091(+)
MWRFSSAAAPSAASIASCLRGARVLAYRRLERPRPSHAALPICFEGGAVPAATFARWRGLSSGSTAAAASTTEDVRPLYASANINVGRLAGAIAAKIRQDGSCHLEACGPNAGHKGLKAIMMANKYLETDFPGKTLAIHVGKVTKPASGNMPETAMSRLSLWPVARSSEPGVGQLRRDQPGSDKPDIIAGKDVNPGLLAGDLVNLLLRRRKNQPDDATVTIGGMGAVATSMSLKCLVLARVYLAEQNSNQSLGIDEQVLAATATMQAVPSVQEEERMRVLWTCRLLSAPDGLKLDTV